MRALLAFALIFAWACRGEAAPKVAFPYDATIESDDAYVRSGPGSKYYPTAKLKRGQRVTVHRHDPGGWHMIAPPPGSFSWVPAKYVDKAGDGRGTIKTNGVAARVGSFESDIRELFQRRLSQGDEVEVLGEKMLAPDSGTGPEELWYRIAPPRGEWRWISGQSLSPAPRDANDPVRADPFDLESSPANRTRPGPPVPSADDVDRDFEQPLPVADDRDYLQNDPVPAAPKADAAPLKERPVVRRSGRVPSEPPPSVSGRSNQRIDAHLEELDRLDSRFRAILDKEPLEWDFSQLEQDYRRLRSEVDSGNLQQMVDTRLTRIEDYRKIRAESEAQARVAEETLRRDAELAAIQRQLEARLAGMRQPRFDGAGILQRSALKRRGAPPYVLLAPNGKVLAYVVSAPGLNLEPWVGRTVGLNGSRVPHPDLRADLITVIRLTPVRLTP